MTGSQLDLFRDRATEPSLTPRQAFALATIRSHAPIRSEDLGAWLCERNLRHSHLQGCEYDVSNGRGVGEALQKKGLARYVRGEGWVPAEWEAEPEPSSQVAAGDAWPEDLF